MSTTDYFVQLPVETDVATLADDAIAALQAAFPSWTPVDGHLEVILIEAMAVIAQNAAEVAARMPAAALRAFGTNILGVPYLAGTPAITTVTFGLADLLPHTIPDGTQIVIDGFAFETVGDVSTPGAATIANVPVQAVANGTDQNGLTGASVSGITTQSWVSSITVLATTAGGTEAEDDSAYTSKLSRQLLLSAFTLITNRDYELWSLNNPAVGRAQSITTAARANSVALTDASGAAVSSGIKAAVLASFAGYGEANQVTTMADPTFTTVTIVTTVKAYPGFLFADVQTRVQAAIQAFLNPASWGAPDQTTGTAIDTWIDEPTVRLNKLIEVIGSVTGVNYVVSATINGSAADLTLSGSNFHLTQNGTHTVTVT